MSKFKVGDRVRITGPSADGYTSRKGKDATIERLPNDYGYYAGKYYLNSDGSGFRYFPESSLELVTKGVEEMKQERRTFKLLHESPSLLKGAIVQERCEDGTQPYDLINAKTHSKDPSYDVSFAKRELVEDAPKFWVEVFKVHPEYMTKEELATWEAFKKMSAAKRKYDKKMSTFVMPPVVKRGRPSKKLTRLEQFVAAEKAYKGDTKKIAKFMGVKETSVHTYRWMARNQKLL